MAIINNGLYRVDAFQQYLGKEVLNTFWYRENAGLNTKADLLGGLFNAQIQPLIAAVQNTGVSHTNIRVTPIFGAGIEFNVAPTAPAGTIPGDQMPSFLAASIRLNRSDRTLRNGWKRFAGLLEQEVGAQSFSGGFVTLLTTLGTAIAADLAGGGDLFHPQIVRKPFSTKALSANWESIDVGGFTVANRPTTQTSRKTF